MHRFGQYTIVATIHEGQETALYRATRGVAGLDDDAQVVLKLPRRRPAGVRDVARLQHEYAILSELALPGVVPALGIEQTEDGVALVLAALDGEPLDRVLAAGRLPVSEALTIATAIASVLADIHDRGVIHRDIKPSNVIVERDRSGVHVVDFGLATRLAQETQRPTSPDALEGTLAYLSPEQTGRMNRAIDRRADLYSFGVTLYQMLTGSLPFVSDDPLELVHSHIARTPMSPRQRAEDIPEIVSALVMKLLAKAPEDRYQSARGLAADLDACLAQAGGAAPLLMLAQHEQAPVLRAPQRVYGRAAEVRGLLEACERTRAGGVELLLVSGYSGIGKSALVHEIHPVLAAGGGTFAAGKFDQLARNTPYAALVQAFRDLVRQALGERESRREALRAELTRALAGGGQVLAELIPELPALLGPQAQVAELGPTEAQNRFHRLLDAFVQVFAGGPAPLVMFLDDLQWADLASLRLLQGLLGGASRRLLVIAAYRDNEVGPAHPLLAVVEELRGRGVPVREINVGPLPVGDIAEMLADLLGGAADETLPLARAIYRKTQGNPFFIGQFLRTLQQDGTLRLDAGRGVFTWDLEALQAREVAENVADFMDRRIRVRGEQTQRALRLAACIGHRFELATLATICELSPAATAAALWDALEEGLVLPEGADQRFIHHSFQAGAVDAGFGAGLDIAFRFSHDRVQQAAYALIAEDERAATHLQVGRTLLAHSRRLGGGEPRGSLLFDVANHLNIGAALITDPGERRMLAALDLAAGHRAKGSTAYAVALGYFRAGGLLLADPAAPAGPDADPLRFALGCEEAECTYLTGAFAEAEPLFVDLLARAPSEVDRAAVYTLQLRMVQVAGKYDAGVDVGAAALAAFGVTLPDSEEAMQAAMTAVLADIRACLEGREISSLLDAPPMRDPVHRAILGLLVGVMPCAYIGRPAMFPYLALKGVSFSLHHGNTEDSCFAYSVYGFMLAAVFGEIPAGFAFSEMSIRLNERLGDAKLRGTLLHLHGDHINFWVRPLRTGLPILEQAFQACVDAGDLVYANFLAFETVWQRYECGEPIAELRRHSERFLAFAAASKNDAVHQTIRLEQQFFAALAGHTRSDTSLDDDGFSAEACLARISAASFGCGVAFHHILRMMLLVLHGEAAAALEAAAAARGVLGAVMAMPIEATFYMFEALAIAADARGRGPAERSAALARMQDHLDRLALWTRHCPENFEHKHLLVRAEAAWLADDPLAAEALYDESIAAARRQGFGHGEALASELCGQFYRARGRTMIAPVYLKAAQEAYVQWGALGKAEQVGRQLPPPMMIAVTRAGDAGPRTGPGSSHTSTGGAGWAFDLATVVRLGQALAGEIELDRLLDRLMRIVLQNAGGTAGALLLERDGALELAASCTADSDSVQLHERVPLSECPTLPATVIQHVARTREALVLADVSQDARFAGDPALGDRSARSILCLALVHRRKLSGVLYIEHGLARDAFTRERVELLEMLCSHAVSAVENALLYRNVVEMSTALARTNEHLEDEVTQRTTALSAANDRLSAELLERERTEQARAQLQEEVIRMQEAMLAELSTPLIPITDSIMVMPLIGSLDARRSELVLQAVLEGAQTRRARVVILDVTGMKTIDTPGVAALVRTAQALRLIGAQALLTGMSPLVAQLLVELGVDLTGLRTYGSLQAGIAFAVSRLGGAAWRNT